MNRYGFALYDGGYTPTIKEELPKVNGKRCRKIIWQCPFYATWMNLITRVCRPTSPCYSDIKICEEWRVFSNFKAWMETQDWEGKQLDKDLLGDGNLYSPETCCFLPQHINVFIASKYVNCNGYMGVVEDKSRNTFRFAAQITDLSGKRLNLGRFNDPLSAHLKWKEKKHEYACQLANEETDVRIKEALVTRYKCSI